MAEKRSWTARNCLCVRRPKYPTETETKAELDAFVDAMIRIRAEAEADPERVRTAPHTLPVGRLDDVKAARELDLTHVRSQT